MLEHDFNESIGCWVGMTARAFERALNEELQPHGITFQQWQVLAWLAFEGDLSQAQLAQRMRVEAPTLVGILDRMERDAWIERHVSAGDRRKKLIRPMPKVQPVWERIRAGCSSVRERAVRGIDAAELEQVRRVLEKLRQNLSDEHCPCPTSDAAAGQSASRITVPVGSSDDDARLVMQLTSELAHAARSTATVDNSSSGGSSPSAATTSSN